MKSDNNPRHIAIIMDGNGRWAKRRLLPRNFGHKKGVETIDRISRYVFDKGVEILTLFAFSTENLRRPKEEVSGIFELFSTYIKKNLPDMIEREIKFKVIGDISVCGDGLKALIADAEKQTEKFNRGKLNICFNYGGRADIVNAANKLIQEGKTVTEQGFADALYTGGLPDPDIVIRTGNEHRISNFLLYQMAYSEIYFTSTLWPDFKEKELNEIIADFKKTNRRFGNIEQ